jgi:hypothetical protein
MIESAAVPTPPQPVPPEPTPPAPPSLSPPSPPPPPPPLNPVEQALGAGWQAFKARPWLLTLPQVILLPLACLVLPMGILAAGATLNLTETPDAIFGAVMGSVALLAGGLGLLALLALAIAAVGYVVAALRIVRGEPTGAGDLLAGLRRAPGIALATLITGGAGAAVAVSSALATALSLYLVDGLTWIGGQVASPRLPGEALASGLAYALAGAIVILGIAALYYVLAGLSQWPFLLLDRGMSARDAVAASWRMMRGHRLALLSLWFAASALNVVGLLLLVFGVIFTTAIGIGAFAGFHQRLASAATSVQPQSAPKPRRTPLAAWAVDAWIALRVTALMTLGVMIGTIAPTIAFNKSTWSPYGPTWILAGMAPLVIVPVAYFLVGWLVGGTPGQRIVGTGWGRFRWLAVVYGLAALVEVAGLAGAIRKAPAGIVALAAGYETARQLVAELPEGYATAPNNTGASDGLTLPRPDPDDLSVSASYRITDTAGSPYFFTLRRYVHAETAKAAQVRLQETGASPAPALGVEAFSMHDESEGVVRIVVRAGDTLIAGEAPPEQAEDLERLLQLQLERLDAAQAGVERVYRWLPAPAERLEEE